MPTDYRINFLESDFSRSLKRLTKLLSKNPPWTDKNKSETRAKIHELCRAIIRCMKRYSRSPNYNQENLDENKQGSTRLKGGQAYLSTPVSGDTIAKIVVVSLGLEDKNLFLEALPLCHGSVRLYMFRSVRCALLRCDLKSLLPK